MSKKKDQKKKKKKFLPLLNTVIINAEEDTVVTCRLADAILCKCDKTEKKRVWWKHMAAGAAAGAISRTITAPFDRLKLFLQAHGSRGSTLRGVADELVKEGGVLSLWRGNGINIFKIAPETALKFVSYDEIKNKIKGNREEQLTMFERFIAGSLAGLVTQTFVYPVDVIRTRLTLRKTGQFSGILDAAMKMYKTEGRRCFYLGYSANLVGIIPYAGVDLSVYETLMETYRHRWNEPSPHPVVVLLCGVTSSFLAQTVSYPISLVRTKLQVQALWNERDIRSKNFPGVKPELVSELQELLLHHNKYIQDFKTSMESGAKDQPDFQVIVKADKKPTGVHRHYFNAPITKEVTILIVGQEFDKSDLFFTGEIAVVTKEEIAAGVKPYSMPGYFVKIYREEGILGFYHGYIPTLMRVVPCVAISYVVYDQICRLLNIRMF